MATIGLITCSDSRDESQDTAGAALKELITQANYDLAGYQLLKDDIQTIANAIKKMYEASSPDAIITCGGTGLSLRDVTPEATRLVCERDIPGIAEYLRSFGLQFTENACLSRAVCMQIGKTIVVNFPGSKRAAMQNWEAFACILPHAIKMACGGGH